MFVIQLVAGGEFLLELLKMFVIPFVSDTHTGVLSVRSSDSCAAHFHLPFFKEFLVNVRN